MKRRLEYLLVLALLTSCYVVWFTNADVLLKVCLGILYITIILYSMYSLMLENRTAQHTLLWIYVLLFFPVAGYIFYLYSGQLNLKGALFQNKQKNDREQWKSMVRKRQVTDISHVSEHHRCFAQYIQRVAMTSMDIGTTTSILINGEETFAAIKKRLHEAKRFIHMEYFTFRSDRLGKEIIEILIEKAKQGVEVRFLYDAVGSLSLLNVEIVRMQESGILVQAFLPIKFGFFNQKFNFRNHRKIVIIDGTIGFIGGLNVGIEYLGENETMGFWRDTHMVMEGNAVQTLHAVFLLDWDYMTHESLLQDERYTTPVPAVDDGVVHVVASGPDTQQDIMSDLFFSMISCAVKSIWIATPYFIPNEAIHTALRVARDKGIEVRIMVPERSDGYLVRYASQSYFAELLRCGVEIYSYQKGFSHQKIIIVDGDLASIGTANMDMRSFHLNFEVNVFLIGTSSIYDLVSQYEEDLKECQKISPVQFYKRGLTERTKESFARLFSGVL